VVEDGIFGGNSQGWCSSYKGMHSKHQATESITSAKLSVQK